MTEGSSFDRAKFNVLWRTFFTQFFTSETVSSDDDLRRLMFWVLAFLLMPGLLLLVNLFFEYQGIVVRAIKFNSFGKLEDTLEWVGLLFVTYSMVTVGFLSACVWDSLTFERRDAMVLGPLPIGRRTIVAAKVVALGAFLAAAAGPMSLTNAFLFAFATADRLGLEALGRHFSGLLLATLGASAFAFALLVVVRGSVGMLAGPRAAAVVGSLLQFAFVLGLFAVVILCPAVWTMPRGAVMSASVTNALPPTWFLGVFEWIRGSHRPYVAPLAVRASLGTLAVVAGALAMSIAGFEREWRLALTPAAAGPVGGSARLPRLLAALFTHGNGVAGATADFTLLTLARNRAPQTFVAMNAALGVAIVAIGLARVHDFSTLTAPRTVILWIPLVVAYWLTVGFRASFFLPSELPAAWTFHANAGAARVGFWLGVRAALLSWLLPLVVAVALSITVPLLGWTTGLWHAAFVCGATACLAEAASMTIAFVPFTQPYEPGHARLKTRWWAYLLGLFLFAYWPVRFELATLGRPAAFAISLPVWGAVFWLLDRFGRRLAGRWTLAAREEPDPLAGIRVLDLGIVSPKALG